MDIQVSSNFERLLFEACGRDAVQVRGLMASLAQSGRFSVSTPAFAAPSQSNVESPVPETYCGSMNNPSTPNDGWPRSQLAGEAT